MSIRHSFQRTQPDNSGSGPIPWTVAGSRRRAGQDLHAISFCRGALGLLALSLLVAAGCQSFEATAPAGFAAFDDLSQFRAVSPDGVVYRVRSEKNEPFAELSFWREALKKRMLDAGYAFVSEGEIQAGAQTGYLLELAAPVGVEDYTYLMALFLPGSDLLIVESAGEVTRFVAHREAVREAIGQIK